jgi:hypothetical protein
MCSKRHGVMTYHLLVEQGMEREEECEQLQHKTNTTANMQQRKPPVPTLYTERLHFEIMHSLILMGISNYSYCTIHRHFKTEYFWTYIKGTVIPVLNKLSTMIKRYMVDWIHKSPFN